MSKQEKLVQALIGDIADADTRTAYQEILTIQGADGMIDPETKQLREMWLMVDGDNNPRAYAQHTLLSQAQARTQLANITTGEEMLAMLQEIDGTMPYSFKALAFVTPTALKHDFLEALANKLVASLDEETGKRALRDLQNVIDFIPDRTKRHGMHMDDLDRNETDLHKIIAEHLGLNHEVLTAAADAFLHRGEHFILRAMQPTATVEAVANQGQGVVVQPQQPLEDGGFHQLQAAARKAAPNGFGFDDL